MARSLDQTLGFLDGDPATERTTVLAFQSILLLVLGAEYWIRAIPRWEGLTPFFLVSVPLASLLCLAGLHLRVRRWAFLALVVTHGVVLAREFPATGNHAYLELMLCVLCALIDPERPEERRLFLRAVKWLALLVMFYSGLQKVVHGYYFRGLFLAHATWMESFRPLLGFLVGGDELARLVSYDRSVGDGPYFVDAPLLLLASNAVWIFEMGVTPFLVIRRTATLAVMACVAFLVLIETAARELCFGLIFTNALLLFLPRPIHHRLVWPTAILLLVLIVILVLAQAGVVPKVRYH